MPDDHIIVHGTFLDRVSDHPGMTALACLAVVAVLLFLMLRAQFTRPKDPPHPPSDRP